MSLRESFRGGMADAAKLLLAGVAVFAFAVVGLTAVGVAVYGVAASVGFPLRGKTMPPVDVALALAGLGFLAVVARVFGEGAARRWAVRAYVAAAALVVASAAYGQLRSPHLLVVESIWPVVRSMWR